MEVFFKLLLAIVLFINHVLIHGLDDVLRFEQTFLGLLDQDTGLRE
jgi:hypothetical protein